MNGRSRARSAPRRPKWSRWRCRRRNKTTRIQDVTEKAGASRPFLVVGEIASICSSFRHLLRRLFIFPSGTKALLLRGLRPDPPRTGRPETTGTHAGSCNCRGRAWWPDECLVSEKETGGTLPHHHL